MPPQIDSQRIPALLAADVARTLSESLLPTVAEIAANVREVALEPEAHPDDPEHVGIYESQFRTASEAQEFFDSKVVDDFQQFVHDEFIDITWPTCPLHHRHPLDFDRSRTAWRCPANGQLVAALGTLPS
jgi:hypothetical protein